VVDVGSDSGVAQLIKAVFVCAVFVSLPVKSAEVTTSSVERSADVFRIQFEVKIDAGVDDVSRLVGDYRNLAAMSPSTVSSQVIDAGNGINTGEDSWLQVVLRPCVLIFCKRLEKVSRITRTNDETTLYDGISQYSSFVRTTESLTVRGNDQATHLIYGAELEPDFYVPTLIGSWLVRRVIVEEMHAAALKAEQMINDRTR